MTALFAHLRGFADAEGIGASAGKERRDEIHVDAEKEL